MTRNRSVKFAVGSRNGRRSSVWKFFTWRDDIYIVSRMFAFDAKVSLHSTGECHYSRTDKWVTSAPGRRNADRHVIKWFSPRPSGVEVFLAFRVQIPESELVQVPNESGIDDVVWLPSPPFGYVHSFNCYITPPIGSAPVSNSKLPLRFLASLPLEGGRWLVILEHIFPLSSLEIEDLRKTCVDQAADAGVTVEPRNRILAFFEGPGVARGMLEMSAGSSNPTAELQAL